jgi:hypothetical protein
MKINSKILVSILASLAVSTAIACVALFILRDMSDELSQKQKYDLIIGKTNALNLMIATLDERSGKGDIQQIGEIRRSLVSIFSEIKPSNAHEEAILRNVTKKGSAHETEKIVR